MQNNAEQPNPGILKSTIPTSQDTQQSFLRFRFLNRRQSSYAAGTFSGFQRIALAVWHHADSWWARVISWSILSFLLYIMLYVITSDEMSYDGHLFRLIVMLVGAHLVGLLVQRFLRVPSLLGMLITGCVLRNVGFYHPTKGAFGKQTRVLKQLATTVGMVKAGMRLVPDAIYSALHCHHGLRLAGLGMIPSFMEAMVTLLVSYLVLGYPPIWAVCLGFLLCPVSPSVITPPMVELMEAGYGEEKNIGVLIHGAAGLDVAFSVSVFDICLALLFRRSAAMVMATMVTGGRKTTRPQAEFGWVVVEGGCWLAKLAGGYPLKVYNSGLRTGNCPCRPISIV